MKYCRFIVITLIVFSTSFYSCQQTANGTNGNDNAVPVEPSSIAPYKPDADWNNYWFQGKAEITSYKLKQSRYGEIHEGTVVNIFVTEDFSKSKQVKLDDSRSAGDDKLPVLKLNQTIKFNTGIYPYSLMMSSFMPLDINNYPHAVKVTASVQEWCGIAYFQLNDKKNKFEIEQRSYFEKEGDKNISIDKVVLEDELWNIIRLNPDKLPKGEMKVLPGSLYLRLGHKLAEAVDTKLSLNEDNDIATYVIEMPSLNRKLSIHFEKNFPHKITAWEDEYPGLDGKILTTSAVKIKDIMLDYWRTHNNADRILRDELGIPRDTQ